MLKFHQFYRANKLLGGICIRLKKLENRFFFQKMPPVSRTVPKTPRSPLCSQSFWFLVKIEGGEKTN